MTWTGENANARDALGMAIAIADVDADGTDDLVLGAPFWDSAGGWKGAVYGISGETLDTQPEDAPLRIYGDSPNTNAYFGMVLANLGDVDGDGNDDVAIEGDGVASIFHGPLDGAMLASDADATVELGWLYNPQGSLAAAGDVDGDGTIDLLIGNPREQPIASLDPGTAWLMNGAQLDKGSTSLALADWKVEGVSESQNVGYQVATAGDIDLDGHADVIVSAPGDSEYGFGSGAVLFFQGPLSGTDVPGDEQASFHGGAFVNLGTSLVPAVDLTGDGLRDLVMGAPYLDEGEESAVFVVPGLGI